MGGRGRKEREGRIKREKKEEGIFSKCCHVHLCGYNADSVGALEWDDPQTGGSASSDPSQHQTPAPPLGPLPCARQGESRFLFLHAGSPPCSQVGTPGHEDSLEFVNQGGGAVYTCGAAALEPLELVQPLVGALPFTGTSLPPWLL